MAMQDAVAQPMRMHVRLHETSMRLIFRLTTILSLLNAGLIVFDLWRSSLPGANLALAMVFVAAGAWFQLTRSCLSHVLDLPTGTTASRALVRLEQCLVVLAGAAGLLMTICLTAALMRLHEGLPLLG